MSDQTAENDAPFRVCCGQQHFGPVCPDGLVMCPICFRRNPKERLHILEGGDGTDATSAPIYSDVCRTCHEREERWGNRVIPPGTGDTDE